VFGIDIETCSACGGALRNIACIEGPVVIEKILAHLDAKAVADVINLVALRTFRSNSACSACSSPVSGLDLSV